MLNRLKVSTAEIITEGRSWPQHHPGSTLQSWTYYPSTAEHLALFLNFVSRFISKRHYFFPALTEGGKERLRKKISTCKRYTVWLYTGFHEKNTKGEAVLFFGYFGWKPGVGITTCAPLLATCTVKLYAMRAVNPDGSHRTCKSVASAAGMADMVPHLSSSQHCGRALSR